MMINNSITPLFFTPLLNSQHANTRADSATDDATITSEFNAAVKQTLERANEQAPALADNLRRMIIEAPDAMPLYLANVTAQSQRDLSAATSKLAALGDDTYSQKSSSDFLKSFQKVLDNANARNVADNQDFLAKYSKYMVALSQLTAKLNGHVQAGEEGKSNIDVKGMLDSLRAFCKEWEVPAGTLGTFNTEAEAKAASNRFRSGTTEVFKKDDGTFDVRFAFSKLAPIVTSLVRTPDNLSATLIMTALKQGKAPPTLQQIQAATMLFDVNNAFKEKDINSHGVQSISLALNDVQKTHQTDLDLLLNEFSRAVSQFDNLVKLFSSLATTLTETCKSFL